MVNVIRCPEQEKQKTVLKRWAEVRPPSVGKTMGQRRGEHIPEGGRKTLVVDEWGLHSVLDH